MTLKQQQDRNITTLKTEFERKAGEVHRIFEKAMKTVRMPGIVFRTGGKHNRQYLLLSAEVNAEGATTRSSRGENTHFKSLLYPTQRSWRKGLAFGRGIEGKRSLVDLHRADAQLLTRFTLKCGCSTCSAVWKVKRPGG